MTKEVFALHGASKEGETEKGLLLNVHYYGKKRDGSIVEDDTCSVWFPKTQVQELNGAFLASSWILERKESDLADLLSLKVCGIKSILHDSDDEEETF